MSNIIENEHNGQRWLFVEVPEDSTNFIYDKFPTNQSNLWFYLNYGCGPLHNSAPISVPEAIWQIHTDTSTIT